MIQLNKPDQAFIDLVQQLWSAEKMLTEAMPAMIDKAQHLGLKKNMALHLAETDQHKEALASIAKQLDFPVDGATNSDMQTILEQGQQSISTESTADGIDGAIIRGAIKVEQYEMKKYEELGELARSLGYEGIVRRLMLTYEEERQTNTKLHFLFKTIVSETAAIGELVVP